MVIFFHFWSLLDHQRNSLHINGKWGFSFQAIPFGCYFFFTLGYFAQIVYCIKFEYDLLRHFYHLEHRFAVFVLTASLYSIPRLHYLLQQRLRLPCFCILKQGFSLDTDEGRSFLCLVPIFFSLRGTYYRPCW